MLLILKFLYMYIMYLDHIDPLLLPPTPPKILPNVSPSHPMPCLFIYCAVI